MQGHVVRLWMIILEMYVWSQIICFVSQLVFRSNGTTSKNTVNKNCFLLSSVLYTVTCNVLIYKSCYHFSRRNSTSPTSKCIDSPGFDRQWIWFPQLWTPNEAWYPIITSRTMIEQMLSHIAPRRSNARNQFTETILCSFVVISSVEGMPI